MWERSKISAICHILGGRSAPQNDSGAFDSKGIPFVRMRDLGKYHLTTNLNETDDRISFEYALENKIKPIPKGAILLPRSGSVALNHRAILSQDSIIVSHICALIVKDEKKINNRYLYYWLSKYDMNSIAKRTTGLDAINFSDLGNIDVSYPDIETQNKIVSILDKANIIWEKREISNQKCKELLNSTFLEMFGDPVLNTKGWKTKTLIELGSFKNGINYKKEESGYTLLCLGVGDFKSYWEIKKMNTLSTINIAKMPSDDYFLKDNDLVFVRSNGNKHLVGRCVIVKPGQEKVTFSGFCIRYRLNKGTISPMYLAHLFKVPTFKSLMLQNGRGANIQNINQELLGAINIQLPPERLQIEFEKRVYHLSKIIEKVELFQLKSEELLKSLSQQVFSERITIDIDAELAALINAIDLDKKDEENKIDSIKKDMTFLQRLIDKLQEQDFETSDQYEKAKHIAFEIMKGEPGLIKQHFNSTAKKVILEV